MLYEVITIYPLAAAPAGMRILLRLNPLTPIVEDFRRVLLLGAPPDWPWFALSCARKGSSVPATR